MKRNPDLERQILLTVESDDHKSWCVDLSAIEDHSREEIGYHVHLLYEASLIEADLTPVFGGGEFQGKPKRLTMAGHQYLDTIRDEEIWRQTKEGAEKVGSWSLETLSQLARGFIRTQVKRLTGEDVDV